MEFRILSRKRSLRGILGSRKVWSCSWPGRFSVSQVLRYKRRVPPGKGARFEADGSHRECSALLIRKGKVHPAREELRCTLVDGTIFTCIKGGGCADPEKTGWGGCGGRFHSMKWQKRGGRCTPSVSCRLLSPPTQLQSIYRIFYPPDLITMPANSAALVMTKNPVDCTPVGVMQSASRGYWLMQVILVCSECCTEDLGCRKSGRAMIVRKNRYQAGLSHLFPAGTLDDAFDPCRFARHPASGIVGMYRRNMGGFRRCLRPELFFLRTPARVRRSL